MPGVLDPLDPGVFQAVFGEILPLLIALEFNHTLQYVVVREQSIIQTKVVLLIALLAAIALVLGIVYWLMRERALSNQPMARSSLRRISCFG